LAVTVTLVLLPAVTVPGEAVTVKVLAAAGLTVTVAPPVMELVTVSVAVTDWLPAVFRVTVKVPTPLVSVELAGSTAWLSPLVKWTVPV
jgi:hypothetical protein